MKTFELRPIRAWDPWYDKAFGFIVVAADASSARQIVASSTDEGCGDECKKPYNRSKPHACIWLDESKTSCEELSIETARIVMRDFAAA